MRSLLPVCVVSVLLHFSVHAFSNISICPEIRWLMDDDLLNCHSSTVAPPFAPMKITKDVVLGNEAISVLNEFYVRSSAHNCIRTNFLCKLSTNLGSRRRVNLSCSSADKEIQLLVLETYPPPVVTTDVCLWICRSLCLNTGQSFHLVIDEEVAWLGHVMVKVCNSSDRASSSLDCEYDQYRRYVDSQWERCATTQSSTNQWISEAYLAIGVVGVFLGAVMVFSNFLLIKKLVVKVLSK